MMADNIVGSLFGVDPAMYGQLKNQRNYADALAVGKQYAVPGTMMNPSLGPFYTQAAQEGQLIGQGVGALLGSQDPELQKITQIKQLSSQFDLTSPTGMREFARALQQVAPNESMMAVKRADEMETTGLTQSKLQSEATKNLREKSIPTSGLGKLLFEKDELLKTGVPANDPRVIAYDQAIAAEGKGKGTSITVDQRGQTAFATGLGTEDAKRVNNAEKLIESASGTLQTLKAMADKDALGVISGTGATARIEALKFLDTAGFTTPAEKGKLANSENFNKLTGDLVLERIKMLGTNPSNADREFINKIVPQLESSATARKQLINYMADKANGVVREASALSTYGRKNQGLGGYSPTIPLIDTTVPKRDISSYSVEELEAMQKKAKPAGAK
jgi:hypothetical protein